MEGSLRDCGLRCFEAAAQSSPLRMRKAPFLAHGADALVLLVLSNAPKIEAVQKWADSRTAPHSLAAP
jgi:hypothetical protein